MRHIGVAAACTIVAALLGAAAVSLSSRGHPVALPLDDAYIYLQYARTAVDGHPGEYAPGEGRSTGATSPLWTGLVVAAAGGLRAAGSSLDSALPTAAIVLATIAVALAFWLAHRLTLAHGAGMSGAWAVVMVCVLTPYWMFGVMNGMETGLYGAALLGGAWVLCGGSVWWLALLAAVRPEGAILALAILGANIVRERRRHARDGDAGVNPSFTPRAAVLVAVVALVTVFLPWLLTGKPAAAWPAKALWLEPDPEVRGFYFPRVPYFALRALWFSLTGAEPQPALDVMRELFRPAWRWVWILFLGGGALFALVRGRGRGPLLLWIAASLFALVAVAWDAQFYRYIVPAYCLLVVSAAVGWFGGSGPVRAIGAAAVIALAVGSVVQEPDTWTTARRLYRGECERMAERQLRVGSWIRETLPADARVAVHDVGAIAFAGERSVVDLVGLVTPELRAAYRHGEGALWEAVENLSPDRRPTHAAVIPAWMPYLARTVWSGDRMWKAGAATRAPVSREFEIWRLSWPDRDPARWPGGDFGDRPRFHGAGTTRPDWTVADAVDIADLASERVHSYRGEVSEPPTVVRNLGFAPLALPRALAMEGGRDVKGPVEFTLRAERGRSAMLVLRSASAREVAVSVHIAGWSADLVVPRGEERFREPTVIVPQDVVDSATDGSLFVRVEGTGYRAFHWWLLQPS